LLRRKHCNANICLELLYGTVLPEADQHHGLGCMEKDEISLFLAAIFTLFSMRNFRYELVALDHLIDYHVLTFPHDVLIIRDKKPTHIFQMMEQVRCVT